MKVTPAQRASIVASSLARGHAIMGTEPAAKPADKPRRDPPGAWGLAKLTPAQLDSVVADLQALTAGIARGKGRPTARAAMPSTARAAASVATIGRRRLTGGSMTQAQKDQLAADTWARLNAGGTR